MKKIIILLIVVIILGGIGYFIYQKNIKNNTSTVSNNENEEKSNYTYFIHIPESPDKWNYTNSFGYIKIYTYEDYASKIEQYELPRTIDEEVFEDNFILVLCAEKNYGYSIEKTWNENDILYLNVSYNTNDDNNNSAVIILSKDMDRDKVIVENVLDFDMTMESYVDIRELPYEYSAEDAKKDNCLVMDDSTLSEYNVDTLDDFIKKVNNKEPAEIRVFRNEGVNRIVITDIKYTPENKFGLCHDVTRALSNNTYGYVNIDSDEIEIRKINSKGFSGDWTAYTIKDENNEFEFMIDSERIKD